MGVALSKNQHGKLVGQVAVFSLNNIPQKFFNKKTQENPWNTQASIITPIKKSPNNRVEITKHKCKNYVFSLLIQISIVIIIVSSIGIFASYKKRSNK